MPKPDRKFVNPLLRPSQPTEETQALPTAEPSETLSTETSTYTKQAMPSEAALPAENVLRRKRGAQAFEKTHERITLWADKRLKAQFEALADEQGVAKTTLLNEALADLLKKHGKTST